MIFKQYEKVCRGLKPETRRIGTPIHATVGNVIAAVPKRGLPAWWFGFVSGTPMPVPTAIKYPGPYVALATASEVTTITAQRWLAARDFYQVRIHIIAVRREPLQDIDEDGARREGVASVEEYAALWDTINPARGKRWEDNPVISVIGFERAENFALYADSYFNAIDLGRPYHLPESDGMFEAGAWA